ncbi:HAD family hydrolase [Thioalkalivibrio paradoxus]|uniref:HAD family hydrolase n=1 Tax=Thioalkalivibrio paradoxus TaxID=108010 RepID=UPI00022C2137|nr:HAD family hydrolase [Thioalkalivibrio paradoxus]
MNAHPAAVAAIQVRVRCITFDLDDTLWPVMPAIHRAEARFYDWLRIHAPQVCERYTPQALIDARSGFMRAAPASERHDLTRLRKRWLRALALETGANPARLESEGFDVFWEARNEVDPDPEAASVLDTLSRHFQIGAISNGNADVFRTPLGPYFDFALPAAEAGAAKPDPEIFRAAARRAGVRPESMLHIGDDAVCDVLGARNAGLHAGWFNPGTMPWAQREPTPDLTFGRLGQIPVRLGLIRPAPLRP